MKQETIDLINSKLNDVYTDIKGKAGLNDEKAQAAFHEALDTFTSIKEDIKDKTKAKQGVEASLWTPMMNFAVSVMQSDADISKQYEGHGDRMVSQRDLFIQQGLERLVSEHATDKTASLKACKQNISDLYTAIAVGVPLAKLYKSDTEFVSRTALNNFKQDILNRSEDGSAASVTVAINDLKASIKTLKERTNKDDFLTVEQDIIDALNQITNDVRAVTPIDTTDESPDVLDESDVAEQIGNLLKQA